MDKNKYTDTFSQLHSSVDETALAARKSARKRFHAAAALIAAAVMLLSAGALAVYGRSHSLRELVLNPTPPVSAQTEAADTSLPEGAQDSAAAQPAKSVSYDPLPEGRDMISLQGYAGSPEHQAMLEWSEFEHGYDRSGEILLEVGNEPTPWYEKYCYNGYLVYSQEMADKLDEITEKYSLSLHSGGIQTGTVTQLKKVFGDFTAAERWGGYYYSDGTFQIDASQDVPDFGIVDFQLRRTMKGFFDTVALNINDAEQYEQWEYDTACGVPVLLALGPEKALIFADLEDSFVAVNVLAGQATPLSDGSGGVTREALEALADSFDFSIL